VGDRRREDVKGGWGKRETEGEVKNGRYMSHGRNKGKPTVSSGLRRTDKQENHFPRRDTTESIVLHVGRGLTVRTRVGPAQHKKCSTATTTTLSLPPPPHLSAYAPHRTGKNRNPLRVSRQSPLAPNQREICIVDRTGFQLRCGRAARSRGQLHVISSSRRRVQICQCAKHVPRMRDVY
jgi:hypothetical protein